MQFPENASLDLEDEKDLIYTGAGRKSTFVSAALNIILGSLQILVGIFSGSQALIADGLHSLADLVSDVIVLVAKYHSHKAPDDEHSYGHHRYENAAALALGTLLIGLSVSMLWHAIDRLHNPLDIKTVHSAALWIAGIALISKEVLFRYMLRIAQSLRSPLLIANAWHARSDAASSLVVALSIVGSFMGFPLLDPIAAVVVGLMILRMGWRFFWNSLHDLMDRSASASEIQEISETLLATPGVLGLHNLRTRKAGDLTIVDVHLEIDGQMTVTQGHDIALNARQRVLATHAVLDVMTHVDPA